MMLSYMEEPYIDLVIVMHNSEPCRNRYNE